MRYYKALNRDGTCRGFKYEEGGLYVHEGDIALCRCGAPLTGTLLIPGREWLCAECGASYGIMNADVEVSTPCLEQRREENDAFVRKWAMYCIPPGSFRRGCNQCDRGDYHFNHATDYEIKASDDAYRVLIGPERLPILRVKGRGSMHEYFLKSAE